MNNSIHLEPPDHFERQQALDIHGSFIVEAPAGSGKTGLLMQRFLRLLAESEIDEPEQALAITFTRKASAEMRNRITGALQEAADNIPLKFDTPFERETRSFAARVLERSAERGWQLLRQTQRLNITTIDSLCAQIVRRLPLLAGGSDLQPVTDAQPLYVEAAQRTLRELGSGNAVMDEALHTLLLHLNGRMKQAGDYIAQMLQLRDQWLRHIPLTDEDIDRAREKFEATLHQEVEDELHHAASLIDPQTLRELSMLAHIAAHNLQQSDDANPLAAWLKTDEPPTPEPMHLPRWRALAGMLLTGKYEWRKTVNAKGGFPVKSPEKAAMTQLLAQLANGDSEDLRAALESVSSLPFAEYPDDHWRIAGALFRVLVHACAELNVLFAERRQCDFTHISVAAVNALERDEGFNDLALAMGTRIQHLLVDELQDTSITQFDLLKSITASWDGVSQTVFLVGDPKQSIYLFREARVELFTRTMQRGLGDLPLQAIQLRTNFRSQQSLVEAFNSDFTRIFNSDDVAAAAVLPPTDGRRDWHTLSFDKSMQTEAQCLAKQAEEISDLIAEHLKNSQPRADGKPAIAILVRNRSHAAPIITELRRRGIAYVATEIDTLDQQPEVQDIAALTRALLHPGDRTAWLAVLRAPWCGLTLASLLTLAGGSDPSQPVSELIARNAALLDAAERARLLRAWNILEPAMRLAHRIPLAELVERTWISLGGAGLAANYQRTDKTSQDVLENIECYLSLLDSLAEEDITVDAALLQQRLQKLYAAPTATPSTAVEILTMHKAKGLEWDVVFVPALHKFNRGPETRLLSWYEFPAPSHADADAVSALFSPLPARGATLDSAAKRLTNWIRGFRAQRETEELKRLFYVACTRARHHLHLFAIVDDRPEFKPRKNSLLHAAWPAFVAHQAEIQPSAQPMLQMAAAAEETMQINRLRAEAEPLAAFRNSADAVLVSPVRAIAVGGVAMPARPESSLAARALGNVVHRWMQILAAKFVAGDSTKDAVDLVNRSATTITALLRHEGAPADQLPRLSARVTLALTNTLNDPHGQWLLAAHPLADAELSLSQLRDNRSIQLRMDRIFEATLEPGEIAATPLIADASAIWIVDYKTSEPAAPSKNSSGQEVHEFIEYQRSLYRGQLESYADAIRLRHGAAKTIHLALYYPLLPALDWWKF